jgi:hypothetical protein
MAKGCKSAGMVNVYRPCDSFIGGGRRMRRPPALRPLSQPVGSPEGAVVLNDGEEDFGGLSRQVTVGRGGGDSINLPDVRLPDSAMPPTATKFYLAARWMRCACRDAECCCGLPRPALLDTLRSTVRSLLPSSEEQMDRAQEALRHGCPRSSPRACTRRLE